jgi:hypothetical protein
LREQLGITNEDLKNGVPVIIQTVAEAVQDNLPAPRSQRRHP